MPATKEGGRSPTEGPTRKQVPHMGSKQGENEDQYILKSRPQQKGQNTSANTTFGNQRPFMVVPYVKGI